MHYVFNANNPTIFYDSIQMYNMYTSFIPLIVNKCFLYINSTYTSYIRFLGY